MMHDWAGEERKCTRLDEAEAVMAVAGDCFTAMADADEDGLRRVSHPKASVIGERFEL